MNCQKLKVAVNSVLTLTCVVVLFFAAVSHAHAQTLTTLFSFFGGPDGLQPRAGLVQDARGNLYGTTIYGGTSGNGVVFRLTPTSSEGTLYNFQGGTDGRTPAAGLIVHGKGDLYGTTYFGDPQNGGTVFKLAPDGTETLLHSFQGMEGYGPHGSLVFDGQGNLFGTVSHNVGNPIYGNVFEIAADGTEKIFYRFQGGSDGAYPEEGLIRDSKGNFFSTTNGGGTARLGTVFELTRTGTHKVIYSFQGGTDGARPNGNLTMDAQGNLFGTTYQGGTGGFGTVFEITALGVEKVLYSFKGTQDGKFPSGGVVQDAAGNLYGTTSKGGVYSMGTFFEITPPGAEVVLHDFTGGVDGASPNGNLIMDKKGALYGTTNSTVYKLTIP